MSNIRVTAKTSPNFIDEEGNAYLVKCPECERENYSIAVATGICVWCGYILKDHMIIESELKK